MISCFKDPRSRDEVEEKKQTTQFIYVNNSSESSTKFFIKTYILTFKSKWEDNESDFFG